VRPKVFLSLILASLLILSSSYAKASATQTILVAEATFVEANVPSDNFGNFTYAKVADSEAGLCFAFLKFNLSQVSNVFNASSEAKLQLHCHNVTSPHVIGVYWCVNNTWSQNNLTFDSQYGFFISNEYESTATVSSNNTW